MNEGGFLGLCAAMVLMTLLYTARAARFDLFQAIQFLAKRITRWDDLCDRALHHLMCYVYTTVEYEPMGWIGDSPQQLRRMSLYPKVCLWRTPGMEDVCICS